MKLIVRVALLLGSLGIALVAFVFSPLHGEPFPLGSGFSWALLCLAILVFWAAVRLHSRWELRAILVSLLGGVIFGIIGLAGGVFWGVYWNKGNLSPIIGFFVTGPCGFVAGAIIGAVVGIVQHLGA